MDWMILAAVVLIFLLSLIGAYTLFGLLDSFAFIKQKHHQAGGAIAGFLLIYAALYSSLGNLLKNCESNKPILWSISGNITREGALTHENTRINHFPPGPQDLTDKSGNFLLENVDAKPKEALPEIYIECDEYYPMNYRLTEDNAIIEPSIRKITLKENIQLSKIEN